MNDAANSAAALLLLLRQAHSKLRVMNFTWLLINKLQFVYIVYHLCLYLAFKWLPIVHTVD